MGLMLRLLFLIGLTTSSYEQSFMEPGPLTPIDGHRIGYVDLTDEMHFEMDIKVNSIPSSDLCNVIYLYPVFRIFIHPSSGQQGGTVQGFYLRYPTGTSDTGIYVGDALVAGQTYHLEVDVTQNWVRIQIDGEIEIDSSKVSHTTKEDLPLYVSDGQPPCNATVANIIISSGGYMSYFHCYLFFKYDLNDMHCVNNSCSLRHQWSCWVSGSLILRHDDRNMQFSFSNECTECSTNALSNIANHSVMPQSESGHYWISADSR